MDTEKIRRRLSILEMSDFKAKITLKSKKHIPFISKIKDFDYSEDDTKVILKRCEETVFPNETKDNQQENYTLYLKDIKEVDRHE